MEPKVFGLLLEAASAISYHNRHKQRLVSGAFQCDEGSFVPVGETQGASEGRTHAREAAVPETNPNGAVHWWLWADKDGKIQAAIEVYHQPHGIVLAIVPREGGATIEANNRPFHRRHLAAMRDILVPLTEYVGWAEGAIQALDELEPEAKMWEGLESPRERTLN